jgi:hypothetical protein
MDSPRGPPCDQRPNLRDRGVDSQQIIEQLGGLNFRQGCQRNRLRSAHMCERSAILGTVRDQHYRPRLGNDGEETSEHGLADLIDPVGVLDDVDRRCGAGQRHRVDQRAQPPPPRVRIDVRQRHIPVTNAQQVIKQHHILGIGVGNLCMHPCPRGLIVEIGYSADRAQQPRRCMERNLMGMRLAKGRKNLDATTFRERHRLTDESALTNARRSRHPDDTPVAADRSIQHAGDGVQFHLRCRLSRDTCAIWPYG